MSNHALDWWPEEYESVHGAPRHAVEVEIDWPWRSLPHVAASINSEYYFDAPSTRVDLESPQGVQFLPQKSIATFASTDNSAHEVSADVEVNESFHHLSDLENDNDVTAEAEDEYEPVTNTLSVENTPCIVTKSESCSTQVQSNFVATMPNMVTTSEDTENQVTAVGDESDSTSASDGKSGSDSKPILSDTENSDDKTSSDNSTSSDNNTTSDDSSIFLLTETARGLITLCRAGLDTAERLIDDPVALRALVTTATVVTNELLKEVNGFISVLAKLVTADKADESEKAKFDETVSEVSAKLIDLTAWRQK